MGRTRLVPLIIKADSNIGRNEYWGEWSIKSKFGLRGMGQPTPANLDRWRRAANESFLPGGVNYHITQMKGFIPHISNVRVIRQRTGELLATFKAPAFEVMR